MRSKIALTARFGVIFLILYFIFKIPMYGQPFSGCSKHGFLTLEVGCTLWIDVVIGFGIVTAIALVNPLQHKYLWIGALVVCLLAALGGLEGIFKGFPAEVVSDLTYGYYHWMNSGLALALGAILSIFVWLVVLRVIRLVQRRKTLVVKS